jgi:hypothetical protein
VRIEGAPIFQLTNLQEFSASVAYRVAPLWRNSSGAEVGYQGRHEIRKLPTIGDSNVRYCLDARRVVFWFVQFDPFLFLPEFGFDWRVRF